jgi:thiamine monophosphate synthase
MTVLCSVSIAVMLIMEHELSFMLRRRVSVVLREGAEQLHIPQQSASWCEGEASVPNPRMD